MAHPAPRPTYARFEEALAWPPIDSAPFEVQGHPRAQPLALTHVSPDAREAYGALVTDGALPDGSVVAMEHRGADGVTRGTVYVMEKRDGAWSYLEVDARGGVLDPAPTRCPICHAGAVADHLFGPPRRKPPRE